MERVFNEIEKLSQKMGLLERMLITMVDAAFGFKVRAGRYQEENQVSDVIASRDLRRLCDLGLLQPVGEKRGRYYIASKPLNDIYAKARFDDVRAPDPYELIKDLAAMKQLALPGFG